MTSDRDSGADTNRRQVLRLLGGGTAGVYAGTGLVGAKRNGGNSRANGSRGVGPCTCGECPSGTVCGKVEGQPEEGVTYTFSSNGDSYSVTITDTKTNKDDEITCFKMSSSYDIEKVCVKGGPDTATYTGSDVDGPLCAPTNPGGQEPEISNFSFCGIPVCESVCYQVDLVWWQDGYPITDISDSNKYGSENLIESYHDDTCNEDGPATFRYSTSSPTNDDCTVGTVSWSVNNDEVTASFDLDCTGDGEKIGLVSYEDDCDYETLGSMDLDDQVYVDSDDDTFTDDGSLTVDLPT